jgi:hypothetical protein
VRTVEHDQVPMQAARALLCLDDRQPSAAAGVDRSLELIGAGHATHQNPTSGL